MRSWIIVCFAVAASALAALAAPVVAADAPAAALVLDDCSSPGLDVEKADAAILKGTEDALKGGGGFAVLKARLPQLEQALGHAPTVLHKAELCGDVIVLHPQGQAQAQAPQGVVLGDLLAAAALFGDKAAMDKALHGRPRPVRAEAVGSPYVRISFYVGTTYNELRDFERALAALNKGLALSPHNPNLVNEAAEALIHTHRAADAQALCERAIASDEPMAGQERGRLYRTRGFALGEQGRFAEAEQSYRDSLTYEPDNRGALNEISYYQRRQGGAPATPSNLMTSDKFKQAGPPAPSQTPQPNP